MVYLNQDVRRAVTLLSLAWVEVPSHEKASEVPLSKSSLRWKRPDCPETGIVNVMYRELSW